MVHFTSTIAIIAGAIGLVAAQSYQDFEIDATTLATFAAPVFGQSVITGGVAEGKAACDAVENCVGAVCNSADNTCAIFSYAADGVNNPGQAGYDSVHYRYNVPTGPRCDLFVDEFVNAQGQCQCSALETQNTAFGCVSAITASGLPQVRRRSRLTPGHVKKAYYEQTRVNGGTFA